MKNLFTDNSRLLDFLPDHLRFINAEGTRLYTKEKRIYFNYFNDSIRFLCGYNNRVLNEIIDNEVKALKEDSNLIYELESQVQEILRINVGYKCKDVFFLTENSYKPIVDNLIENSDQFFININSNFNIPEELENSVIELEKFLKTETDFKKDQYTAEGWSVKKIKKVFSEYKKRIKGLIINPVLINRGCFLDDDTCELFIKLCKRNRIPIIWDESLSCFFRCSTFYLVNQYRIEPDFLVINSSVSENTNAHILITKKSIKKRFKRFSILEAEKNKTALIVIHSILYYISKTNLVKRIDRISKRLSKKLIALSENTANRFGIENRGLILFVEFQNEKILEKFRTFSLNDNTIVLNNEFNAVLLDPQITISTRAVDNFIQTIDNFFKVGLKLPNP